MLGSPEAPVPEFTDDELDRMLERARARSTSMHARRRRFRLTASGALAALMLAAAGTLIGLHASGGTSGPASRAADRLPGAPKWRLVGEVTPSWRTLPGLGFQPGFSLACPAASTCYVEDRAAPGTVSAIEVTRDGGTTWQKSALPAALSDPSALACPGAATCAVLGVDSSGHAAFLRTADGGRAWTVVAGPSQLTSPMSVTSLTCRTATSCAAIASGPFSQSGTVLAFVTSDGGTSWTASNLPSGFVPRGLQCLSAHACVATGFYQSPAGRQSPPPGTVLFSTNGGSSWTTAALPSGLGPLSSLSCGDVSDCVASFFGDHGSSSEVLTSTDSGQSWSASGLPDGMVTRLSCPTASQCWAAGIAHAASGGPGPIAISLAHARGLVASTSDAGRSWQPAQLPRGVMAVMDISCPAGTSCYALAFEKSPVGLDGSIVLLASG